jgi:tRNA A-37 threonylcarbamoyl transferase component Bud32
MTDDDGEGGAPGMLVIGSEGDLSPRLAAAVARLDVPHRFVATSEELVAGLRQGGALLVLMPWSPRCPEALAAIEAEAPRFMERVVAVVADAPSSLLARLLGKRGLGAVCTGDDDEVAIAERLRGLLVTEAADLPTLPPQLGAPIGLDGGLRLGATVAGRFVVEGLLGSGGAAEVYRVRDLELDQELALKLLRRDSAVPQVEARFRQELAITRRLHHPNIVRTFDFGSHADRLFFTMELLEGPTMQDVFEQRYGGPWPCVGLDRMADVARGLAAAHASGVVHRDVKPDNVFLVDGGTRATIADFGIAKPAAASMAHTQAGTVLGTLEYMAPERLLTDMPATPATDTYAIVVMLYVDWTGRLPFAGDSDGELVDQICSAVPERPRDLNPQMPADVELLIQRLLTKKARKRLADANVVADQLEALAAAHGGGAG